EFDDCYILPEGGTNDLAVRGCEEVLTRDDIQFDYICCAVGTGGTLAGIANSAGPDQQVLGFPALKGNGFETELQKLTDKRNWSLINDYHFGGYGKVTPELVRFMNNFKAAYNNILDPVYTAKMVISVMNMIKTGYFKPDSK